MNNTIRLLNNKQFKQALESAEREIYLLAYEYTRNNQLATSKLLGVSRGTLISKLKLWKVPRLKDFRERLDFQGDTE